MQENKTIKQVKSKKRVADHGEVFTNEREVNAMLDLVKQEAERIDSRFLEPACGDGNFLVEILRRKLEVVSRRVLYEIVWSMGFRDPNTKCIILMKFSLERYPLAALLIH